MTITTEDAEAFARQLENNDPGVSDPVAIEFFGDVAAALRALAAERDRARRAREAAARAQGVAEGRLAASEMSGVVEGWKARAERAEAEAERLREVIRRYGDRMRMAWAPAELQHSIDAALEPARATLNDGE